MLPSFEIENFRTFSHLRIDHMGGVNLVVGRNNVGKTMLLEAIRLYALDGNPSAIFGLLYDRDELLPGEEEPWSEVRVQPLALFHGRRKETATLLQTHSEDPSAVRIEVGSFNKKVVKKGTAGSYVSFEPVSKDDIDASRAFEAITIHAGKHGSHFLPFDKFSRVQVRPPWEPVRPSRLEPAFVRARTTDPSMLARQWDAIVLHEAEDRVNEYLRIVAPVARVTAVERPGKSRSRMFLVRMEGKTEPVSLKSLGDGMVRIFELAVALESARNGPHMAQASSQKPLLPQFTSPPRSRILLVDEFENGIHYTILPDLWRFFFQAARLHNVQVFATTHSWDCVEAFQQAASENQDTKATLIRLEQKGDQHKAVTFSENELAIVARDEIEVR